MQRRHGPHQTTLTRRGRAAAPECPIPSASQSGGVGCTHAGPDAEASSERFPALPESSQAKDRVDVAACPFPSGTRTRLPAMRRLTLLLGTLVVLAGCTAPFGGGSDVGSLGTYQPDAHQCTPLRHSTWVMEGSNSLLQRRGRHRGDPQGRACRPERARVELGPSRSHPSSRKNLDSARRRTWLSASQPLRHVGGISIRPSDRGAIRPGRELNLLLYLKVLHGNGTMQPPKVTYLEKGHIRVWTGGETLRVPAGAKCRGS